MEETGTRRRGGKWRKDPGLRCAAPAACSGERCPLPPGAWTKRTGRRPVAPRGAPWRAVPCRNAQRAAEAALRGRRHNEKRNRQNEPNDGARTCRNLPPRAFAERVRSARRHAAARLGTGRRVVAGAGRLSAANRGGSAIDETNSTETPRRAGTCRGAPSRRTAGVLGWGAKGRCGGWRRARADWAARTAPCSGDGKASDKGPVALRASCFGARAAPAAGRGGVRG